MRHNTIISNNNSQRAVRVAVRVRPPFESEIRDPEFMNVAMVTSNEGSEKISLLESNVRSSFNIFHNLDPLLQNLAFEI